MRRIHLRTRGSVVRIRLWGRYPDEAICLAPDCDRAPVAGGLCNRHRLRVKNNGSLDLAGPKPLFERITKRLTIDANGCWIWQGAINRGGYGIIGRGRRGNGNVLVHRGMYEELIGEIPDGLHLDHLCRVKACANPWHLDPVTQAVNNRRMGEARRAS